MEVVTRQEALSRGLKKYFTGKPCKNGHTSERYVSSMCVQCSSESAKQKYDVNREHIKAKSKEWYSNNRDKAISRVKNSYDPVAKKEYDKAYRDANRDKYNAGKRRYKKNNPAASNLDCAIRRSHIKLRTPNWVDKSELRKVYEETHRLTKETGIKHHTDHIIPLRAKFVSGLNVPWNLQSIPASDNVKKNNTIDLEEYNRVYKTPICRAA